MRWRTTPWRLTGSISAMITPFTTDGALDEASLSRLARWQVDQGSHGLSIGGSTGEPATQSPAERGRAMTAVARSVAGRVPFLVGTGAASLGDTLDLTQQASDCGADAVLVVTPYYTAPRQPDLLRWYTEICRTFPDLPVIAYNVPGRTAVDLLPETVHELFTGVDNFVGIKETSRDFGRFADLRHRCGPELLIWSGVEALCLPLLAIGGTGYVTATANLAPAACARLYDAWAQGDVETARSLHDALMPLAELLFVETNPGPMKYLLHARGAIAAPTARPPLSEPSPASCERIEELAAQAAPLLAGLADVGFAGGMPEEAGPEQAGPEQAGPEDADASDPSQAGSGRLTDGGRRIQAGEERR